MSLILGKIKALVKNSHRKNSTESSSFFDLSTSQKVKIIRKATKKANEDQKRLVDEFDSNYCHGKCN